MDIDEIRRILEWDAVYQTNEVPVVCADISEIKKIKYIANNPSTYYINHPDFANVSISFLISINHEISATTQYYVVGNKLHRDDGPAYISTDTTGYCNQTWYTNGIINRPDEPAEHKLVIIDPTDDYLIKFESSEYSWITHGTHSVYPIPDTSNSLTGHFNYKMVQGCPKLHDGAVPAFYASKTAISWGSDSSESSNRFRIRRIVMNDYVRHYDEGVFKSHECSKIVQLSWIVDGALITSGEVSMDYVRKHLLQDWNVWGAPLFKDEMDMMFAMQGTLP